MKLNSEGKSHVTDWRAVFGPDYPKINTIFERDKRGVIIPGKAAIPEFRFLWDCPWDWDEKVDGTNIRLHWDGSRVYVAGREDNALLSARLVAALAPCLEPDLWNTAFPQADDVTLYGEGYGAGIQDKGAAYRAEPSVIVFDANISGWWLSRENVRDIAGQVGLDVVPLYMTATIAEAWDVLAGGGLESHWPGARIEGLVGRPAVDLYSKKGERLMAKMKVRDHADWLRAQEQPAPRAHQAKAA